MTPKQYVTTILGMIGVVSAVVFIGSVNSTTGIPDPITVDGQTINFTWTDDNNGENLLIYTDKSTYTNGISHADVYVAVVNKTGTEQDIELMGYFRDDKKRIKDVSILTQVTSEVPNPVYEEICRAKTDAELKIATSTEMPLMATTTCEQILKSTSTSTVVENKWVPTSLVFRDGIEKEKEKNYLAKSGSLEVLKSVDNFNADKKSKPFKATINSVTYYKVVVEFPKNNADNFFFEAIGSEGGYGHLN
jgi:hypothetical protein